MELSENDQMGRVMVELVLANYREVVAAEAGRPN